jgi:hypothetical protein
LLAPSGFLTRRRFLQTSAPLIASGAPLFGSSLGQSDTYGQSTESFAQHQEQRRKELWNLLGELPWQYRPGPATILSTEKHEGYDIQRLVLDLNGIEPVRRSLADPPQTPGARPRVALYALACQHVRLGEGAARARCRGPACLRAQKSFSYTSH